MFRKSKRYGNEPRKTNEFGWSRKRGGAGAVACALGITAMLLVLSLSTTIRPAAAPPNSQIAEPELPDDGPDPDLWEMPDKTTVPVEHNAGTPNRMPI